MSVSSASAVVASQAVGGRDELASVVIRFAGDSGDGMQLTGNQFTLATAIAGNDLVTFPDIPAEIRAPVGTTFGVSAFQINFGSRRIKTAGDALDALVAMNPAALKVEVGNLKPGGLLIVDSGTFGPRNLRKAGYQDSPLEDGSLDPFRVIAIDMSKSTLAALEASGLTKKEALRCKNMWALGFVYWIYGRDRQPTSEWLKRKFASHEGLAQANIAAMNAGYTVAEASEVPADFPELFGAAPRRRRPASTGL